FINELQSFDEALDCTAANNRLKRRSDTIQARANSGLRRNWLLTSVSKTIFLTRTELSIRVRKTFCHHAGEAPAGIGKAMSVTSGTKTESGLGETIRVIIHALLIALVIRTFLFQPFNIPSGSMKATLLVGDYLFVSKYSSGYSHYSIPFSPPLFSGRIFGSEPSRGDIVVFRLPKEDSTDFIKRVIGLPGDRIQMKDGLLHINDVAVKRERLSDFIGDDPCGSDATARVKRWRETLPN